MGGGSPCVTGAQKVEELYIVTASARNGMSACEEQDDVLEAGPSSGARAFSLIVVVF